LCKEEEQEAGQPSSRSKEIREESQKKEGAGEATRAERLYKKDVITKGARMS
jgi:hypothetical protein